MESGWKNLFKAAGFMPATLMTAQMKTTIYQILNNPHKGRVGNIYLESKALELIALRLEQVFASGGLTVDNSMAPDDRDPDLPGQGSAGEKPAVPALPQGAGKPGGHEPHPAEQRLQNSVWVHGI